MLVNQILFWLMITEAVICLIISLPFGKRVSQTIIQFLTAHFGGKDSTASLITTIALTLVSILFLSDVSTCYKHHATTEVLSDGLRLRLLVAQRDMYISGFVLFLFLLLRLVYISMDTNIRLEKNLTALKSQAEGASAGYAQQLEENESMKKQLAKVQQLLGSDVGDDDDASGSTKKTDVLAKLIEENAQLSTQLETTTQALKDAENAVEVVKKQAEGQSSAFMKLMDEKAEADKRAHVVEEQKHTITQQTKDITALKAECDSLKMQIQDYDFMFAEAKKKAN